MADTTITGLNGLSPSTNTYVPISNGTTTGKALYNPVPVGGIIMWSGAVANIPTGWALCNGQVVNGNTTPNLLDRFIIGAGSATYNPGSTGGSSTITPSGTIGSTAITPTGTIDNTAITPAGSVGNTAITPAGTVGNTTLTTAQIPTHSHTSAVYPCGSEAGGYGLNQVGGFRDRVIVTGGSTGTSTTGGGGSHNHTFAGTSQSHNHTFTGTSQSHNHSFTGTSQSHNHTFTSTSQTSLPPYYALAYIMRVY
jgi:hypothetical protein